MSCGSEERLAISDEQLVGSYASGFSFFDSRLALWDFLCRPRVGRIEIPASGGMQLLQPGAAAPGLQLLTRKSPFRGDSHFNRAQHHCEFFIKASARMMYRLSRDVPFHGFDIRRANGERSIAFLPRE